VAVAFVPNSPIELLRWNPGTRCWACFQRTAGGGRAFVERPSACCYDGRVFLAGGLDTQRNLSTALHIFDPYSHNDVWVDGPPFSVGRCCGGMAVLDNSLFLVGGYDAELFAIGSVEAFDLTTRTWRRCADLPEMRAFGTAVVQAGTLFVFGGCTTDEVCTQYRVKVCTDAISR
jgi:hypothetical protein